jgi:hypothetical protein
MSNPHSHESACASAEFGGGHVGRCGLCWCRVQSGLCCCWLPSVHKEKTDLQTDSEGICTISSLNSCVSKWFFTDFFGTVRVKNNEMQFLLLNLPWDTHRQMRKGQFFVCHYNFHQPRIRHHKTSYPIYAIELQN